MDEVLELEIDVLQPNPLQPRGLITPESLVGLTDSIREHGVLEPLVIAKTPAGFQIIAGERRWRAAKIAGLVKVPVVIRDTTPVGMLEMALVENVQRSDLNPLERALAFKRLVDEFGFAPVTIATRIGKSQPFISNTLRLLNLPDILKDALASGATTEGHARALMALEQPDLIVEAYKQVLRRRLSVRGAEELARNLAAKAGKQLKQSKKVWLDSDELVQITQDLTNKISQWGVKTKVKTLQSRIQAQVIIKASGPAEVTSSVLQKIRQALLSA